MTAAKKVSDLHAKKKAELPPKEETGAQRMARERAISISERAKAFKADVVVNGLSKLKLDVAQTFDGITAQMLATLDELGLLREELAHKTSELFNTHQIKNEADSLQALLLSHHEQQLAFDVSILDEQKAWDAMKKERDALFKAECDERLKKRAREEEQYAYDNAKKQRDEEARFQGQFIDKMALANAMLEGREKIIAEREQKVDALEKELYSLNTQMSTMTTTHKAELDKAVAMATNSLKRDLTHSHELETNRLNNELALKENQVTQLNNQVYDLKSMNTDLAGKYQEANNKVQQIAERAIDGASKQAVNVQLAQGNNETDRRK